MNRAAAMAELEQLRSAARVTCGACCGTGQRELTPTEAVTFAAVTDEWSTTGEVGRRHRRPPKPTALANRLVTLERLGLIETTRDVDHPREKLWRRSIR